MKKTRCWFYFVSSKVPNGSSQIRKVPSSFYFINPK
jgi:hypothetical protein